jgi:hypothetical protein
VILGLVRERVGVVDQARIHHSDLLLLLLLMLMRSEDRPILFSCRVAVLRGQTLKLFSSHTYNLEHRVEMLLLLLLLLLLGKWGGRR